MVSRTTLLGSAADEVLDDGDFKLLLLANVSAVLGTTLLSPVLSSLIDPLGTTPDRIGLIMSVFTAPGILMIPVAGYVADRWGRKPVITAGLILFGGGGLAISFATEFRFVLLFRLIQGVGYAGIVPIVIATIGDLYVGEEETAAQGLRFTTSGLSMTVFPPLAGLLVVLGWQYPFLLYAVSIPIAVFLQATFTEPERKTRTSGANAPDGGVRSILGAVSRVDLLPIVVARTLAAVVLIGFLTYVSIIVVTLIGGSVNDAGLVVALNSVVFAVTASQIGRISGRLSSRYLPLVAGTVCLGVGFGLIGLARTLPVVLAGTLLLGVGVGATQALYRSIVTMTAPDHLRGGVVSVAEAIGRTATSLTPIGMGAAIGLSTPLLGFDAAVRATAVAVSAACAIGGLGCLLVWRRRGERA